MSFSQDVKIEITGKRISRPCCIKAACYAVACFGKYFDANGVVLQTETEAVANYAKKMYSRCDIQGTVQEKQRATGSIYEFAVKDAAEVEKLLALFGHTGSETALRINPQNLTCPGCVATFVATAFLCAGTMTDPTKEYNLEFFTSRYNLARDFEALLGEHEFRAHRTLRKGANIIYLKASEQIENILAFMGAGNAAMEIMNSRMLKEVRNKTNRLSNCETANIGKSIQANVQACKAIRFLQEQEALALMQPQLREAAEMRLAYPDDTLSELCRRFEPPISKSGLSHRLKKLVEAANRMQENHNNA